jgi:hypothetical protein
MLPLKKMISQFKVVKQLAECGEAAFLLNNKIHDR